MVYLNHGWIESGEYKLGEVSKLKWENTQEFHDRLIELQSDVHKALNVAENKLFPINLVGYHDHRFKNQLCNWSDDDFISFCRIKSAIDGYSVDEIKHKIKELLFRDQNQQIQVTLKKYRDEASDDPVEFVNDEVKIKNLIDKLNSSRLMIKSGINKLEYFDRIRFISKSVVDTSATHKVSVNVDAELSRLIMEKQSLNNGIDADKSVEGVDKDAKQ